VKASLFYLPTVGNRREIEAGLAGMRPELYQRMLRDISEQVRLADDLGYDSVSFTEHHFHIEGFEGSNNPVLLDLYFAMQRKRIRLGAGRPGGVDREGLCAGRNGRHGYPHARKAAPPAADRMGILLHL
jgi:hypothetical protein